MLSELNKLFKLILTRSFFFYSDKTWFPMAVDWM